MEEMKTKRCPKCGEIKNMSDFNKSRRTKDGFQCWCRVCDSESNNKYYKNNKEKILTKQKEYQKSLTENGVSFYDRQKKYRQSKNFKELKRLQSTRRNKRIKEKKDFENVKKLMSLPDYEILLIIKKKRNNGKINRGSVHIDIKIQKSRFCYYCNSMETFSNIKIKSTTLTRHLAGTLCDKCRDAKYIIDVKKTHERKLLQSKNIDEQYVKKKIREQCGIPSKEIPQGLIDLKRSELRLFRAIKGARS